MTQSTATIYINDEQVKSKIIEIGKKVLHLRKELANLPIGDAKNANKITNDIKKLNTEARKMSKEFFDANKVMKNLSGATMNSLNAALVKFNAELKNTARGSARFKELQGNIKAVKTELSGINNDQKKTEGFFSRMSGAFSKYSGFIMSTIAGVTGVTLALKSMRDEMMKLEESSANLKALTGLEDADIAWLEDQANQLSTTTTDSGVKIRQSAQEIVDAFTLVGSAKPELLTNKEALKEVTEQALVLASASRMNLNDAVEGVTLTMNQYSAAADEAARYTNVLAAGSKFGAANVESQTTSIAKAGVAAAGAKVPIEQLTGAIQTLAEKGIKNEIAGTGLKKFFLTLETGPKEVRPSLVGLQTALERLKAAGLDATQMKKMFGEEGYNVASVLIKESQRVEYFTKAVTGTSTALEQARINSQTGAASMDQLKNQMQLAGMELAEKLNPAMLKTVSWFKAVIMVLPGVVDFTKKWGAVILITTAAIIYYNIHAKVALALTNAQKIASLGVAKAQAAWRIAMLAFNVVSSLFTLNITRASAAIKMLTLAIKTNPLGFWVTVISSAILGIMKLTSYMRDNRKEMEKSAEAALELAKAKKAAGGNFDTPVSKAKLEKGQEFVKETDNLLQSSSTPDEMTPEEIKAAKIAIKERLSEYEELKKKFLSQEKVVKVNEQIDDLKMVHGGKQYLVGKDKKRMTAASIISSKKAAIDEELVMQQGFSFTKLNEQLSQLDEALLKLENSKGRQSGITDFSFGAGEEKQSQKDKKFRAKEEKLLEQAETKKLKIKEGFLKSGLSDEEKYKEEMLKVEMDHLDAKISLYHKEGKDTVSLEAEKLDRQIIQEKERAQKEEKEKEKALKKKEDLLESHYDKEELALKQSLIDRKITQDEFDNQMLKKEIEALTARIALYKEAGKETVAIETERAEKVLALLDKTGQVKPKGKDQGLGDYKNTLSSAMEADLELQQSLFDLGLISEEAYLQGVADLKAKYREAEQEANQEQQKIDDDGWKKKLQEAQQYVGMVGDVFSAGSQAVELLRNKETSDIEREYDRRIQAAAGNTALQEQLEAEKEEKLKEVKKKYADVDMAMKVGQIIASSAVAIMQGFAINPIFGGINAGIVTAMMGMQIASVVQERDNIKNLWTGGYTSAGDPYEPKGIVHSDEFVGNRFAVRNPAVKKVFDMVDVAQKNNTIGSMTERNLISGLGGANGSDASSGSVRIVKETSSSQGGGAGIDKALSFALNKLVNKLDQPLESKVYIKGSGGIERANNKLSKIEKIVS